MYMTIVDEGLGWKERGEDRVSYGISDKREKFRSLREVRLEGFNRKEFIFRGAIVGIHDMDEGITTSPCVFL